jgi:hypothetical protein
MSTFSLRCLCGRSSPLLGSREAMRGWHAKHKREDCVAIRSRSAGVGPFAHGSSQGATADRERIADAELAELHTRANRCRPIILPDVAATMPSTWVDTAHSDPWGAPPRGPQLLARQWSHGNCLKAAIASIVGAPIERIPDPTSEFHTLEGWIERYDKRLRKVGYRLEQFSRSCCPPRNPNQLWIACLRMDGPADHVVVARGHCVVHDPLGEFQGFLPWNRLVDGMIVVPTRRVVPSWSPA